MANTNSNITKSLLNLLLIKWGVWGISIILLISIFFRLWGINYGLPYITFPDESMTVNRALRFGSGDLNPHFFYYPSLQMYLIFFFYAIHFIIGYLSGIFRSAQDFAQLFIKNPESFYLIGRLVTVLFGISGVYFVYRLSRDSSNNTKTALWSMILAGLAPVLVEQSHIIKPEPLLFCFSILFMLFLVKFLRTKKIIHYFFSAIFLGFALGSKYNAIALVPVLVMAHLFVYGRKELGKLILGLVIVILAFLVTTPFALLDSQKFLRDIYDQARLNLILIPEATEFGLRDYLMLLLNWSNGTVIVGFTGLIGIVLLLKRRTNIDWLVLSCIVFPLMMVIIQKRLNTAYFLPAFPALFICAGEGIEWLRKKLSPIIFVVLILVIISPSLWSNIRFGYRYSQKDTRVLAKEWVEKNVDYGTKILVDPEGPPIKFTRKSIEEQHKTAVKINHIKKEYFKLQLETYSGNGYDAYFTEQPFMITPPELKKYSQSIQRLESVTPGIEYLKTKGYKYVIISSWNYGCYATQLRKQMYPAISYFYDSLDTRLKLVAVFNEDSWLRPGPTIKIYQLK